MYGLRVDVFLVPAVKKCWKNSVVDVIVNFTGREPVSQLT
jgi:hypothetical protein